MRSKRTRFVRLTSLGGALMLVLSALAVLGVAPTPASAASVNENFAGYIGEFGLYTSISIGANVTQPALEKPGGTFTTTFGGGSQVVPTTQSGFNINYINGLNDIVPVPSGATFKSGSLSTGLTWTFVNKGVTTHGAYDVNLLHGGQFDLHGHAPLCVLPRIHLDPVHPDEHRTGPFRRRWDPDPSELERVLHGIGCKRDRHPDHDQ